MQPLLEALLDSWDRNNTILVNLLRALPQDVLQFRAMEGSKSFAEMFIHIHGTRLFFISECVPELSGTLPEKVPADKGDSVRIAQMLNESAQAVRGAVQTKLEHNQQMEVFYDHPILMLQHLIWHDAYHHGQIKLALKLAGRPLDDEEIGAVTWDVWMDKH